MIKHGFLHVVIQMSLTACSVTPDSDSGVKAQVSDYSAASLMMMEQIVYSNCGDCHYDGNPQNLVSFQNPRNFFGKEREIRAQIDSGKMPKGRLHE